MTGFPAWFLDEQERQNRRAAWAYLTAGLAGIAVACLAPWQWVAVLNAVLGGFNLASSVRAFELAKYARGLPRA